MHPRINRVVSACLCVLAATAALHAGEWPQWRGPAQTGIAGDSTPLADSWPAGGPRLIWKSEQIPGGPDGGFSSLTVADGRGYLYVNWKTHEPITTRKLSTDALRRLGWPAQKLPEDLVRAMEEARTSPERARLRGPELKAWVDKWTAEHVTEANQREKTRLVAIATERLMRGAAALPLETLEKLAEVKDREFPTAAAMDDWLREANVPEAVQKAVLKEVPTTVPKARDVILCLDLRDGNVIWKRDYPGSASDYGSSSTACVADGRVIVAGTKTVYCLRAADGGEIWKVPVKASEVSSSPVVVEGVAAILAGELMGLDVRDGNRVWTCPSLKGTNASPVVWRKDGKAYLLCNTGGATVALVEPATGKVLWEVPGGGSGTAALGDGVFAIFSEKKETGLALYQLASADEKPRKLWSQPLTDRGTTPVLYGGALYAVGANKALCLSLADGNQAWEQKYTCEIASPVLADGKLFALVEGGGTLLMVRATADKFDLLAKHKLKAASCSSPVVLDGRMYLRLEDGVACYDLRK